MTQSIGARVRAAHRSQQGRLTDDDLTFDETVWRAEVAAAKSRLSGHYLADVAKVIHNTTGPTP